MRTGLGICFILLSMALSAMADNLGPQAIDTLQTVRIGGIDQMISIKGKDKNAPLMLFLHGGPGRSLMGAAEGFTGELLKHFLVVQWDQRETGKTLELEAPYSALTIDLFQQDAHELIVFLLRAYDKKKLFLVSHSWGSTLGFDIAQHHGELLQAYIAISPIVDQVKATELTIDMLKSWAVKEGNQPALSELKKVSIPIETKEDLFYQQKWLFIHNGVEFAQKPNFKSEYFKWMDEWFPIWKESVRQSLFESVPEVSCPIYFFEGIGDKQKSHHLVKRYYKTLKAPKKKFYWFRQSGHTVFNTEAQKMQKLLIEIGAKNN